MTEQCFTEQYVIYESPKDYPNKFVMRKWVIESANLIPKEVIAVANTIAEVRKCVPPGFVCLQRSDNDDPIIRETWI